jgi:hypothetical protein
MRGRMRLGLYRVVLRYREPTFEARIGRPMTAPPYVFERKTRASSPEEAVELCVEEFWRTAALSGVGWIRELVESETRVDLLDADGS